MSVRKNKDKTEKKDKDKDYSSLLESAAKKFSIKKFSIKNGDTSSVYEFASTPYKDKPCAKCQAQTGGLCKCALKKSNK